MKLNFGKKNKQTPQKKSTRPVESVQDDEISLDDIDRVQQRHGAKHTYKKTKWYESTLNVVLAVVAVVALGFGVWQLFGTQIAGIFGIGTEYVIEQDLEGRYNQYQQDIKDEVDSILQEDVVIDEAKNVNPLGLPESFGKGTYLVGVDVAADTYLVSQGSIYVIYDDEYALINENPNIGLSTLNNRWDASMGEEAKYKPRETNTLVTLMEGQYLTVINGGYVLNATRTPQDVKINESVVLEAGNHYTVGIDFPPGYYRVVSTNYRTETKLTLNNINEDLGQDDEVIAERQNYTKFAYGNVVIPNGDVLLTRVDSQHIY